MRVIPEGVKRIYNNSIKGNNSPFHTPFFFLHAQRLNIDEYFLNQNLLALPKTQN